MIPKLSAFVFVALCVATTKSAFAGDPLADLRACPAQTDDERRLECYDAAMKSLPVAAVPAASPAVPATSEQKFGYRGDVARAELDRKAAETSALERLDAQVMKAEKRPYGEFVVTLDNGQVWAQKQLEPSVKPKVGDSVTIKPAALGSFLLVTKSGRSTRVTRLK
ncbi:hypothetical protein [Povalibacter sp.]|uniref:hypothetical protein n=1 Tax=Povalibacter sp. TaxID=1962978 RepID=UPI002F3FBE2B